MITELLLSFFFTLSNFILGLLPTAGPPAWIQDGKGLLNDMLAGGGSLGAWIPWSLAGTVLAAVLASALIGFTIKVVRVILSLFTGGGGGAA